MSLPLAFRSAAQAEFDDAAAWYEAQRPGLGRDFVAKIQRVLDSVAADPKLYPVVFGDVRMAVVSRFPYCVYYRLKPSRVVVIAVFHTHRNEAVWQARR